MARQTPYDKLKDALAVLAGAGWTQTGRGRFTPPYSLVKVTPERTPESWWGSPSYPVFTAVDIAMTGRPVYWTERQNAPWVSPASRKVPVAAALEFVRETAEQAACGYLSAGPRYVPVFGGAQ